MTAWLTKDVGIPRWLVLMAAVNLTLSAVRGIYVFAEWLS